MSKSRRTTEKSIRNINQKRKIKDKLRFMEGQSQQELQVININDLEEYLKCEWERSKL